MHALYCGRALVESSLVLQNVIGFGLGGFMFTAGGAARPLQPCLDPVIRTLGLEGRMWQCSMSLMLHLPHRRLLAVCSSSIRKVYSCSQSGSCKGRSQHGWQRCSCAANGILASLRKAGVLLHRTCSTEFVLSNQAVTLHVWLSAGLGRLTSHQRIVRMICTVREMTTRQSVARNSARASATSSQDQQHI